MKRITQIFVFFIMIAGCAEHSTQNIGTIIQFQQEFEQIIKKNALIEVIADGFEWSEGPVWWKSENKLLFTDIPHNTVYEWSEERGLQVFLRPAGYTGDQPPGFELGANGLLFDHEQLCDAAG